MKFAGTGWILLWKFPSEAVHVAQVSCVKFTGTSWIWLWKFVDLPSVRENSQVFVLLSIGQLLRSTACFCYCTESVEYGLIWPKDCQLRRKAADFYGHGAAVGENSGYLTDLCVFVCVCVCLSVSVFVCMCLCLFVCLPLVTPYQVLPHQVMT